jgi:flavin-binding protein dodecin
MAATLGKGGGVSVAKVVEITATSPKSFEDAIHSGIARASKTLEGVQGAWIKEQKVVVSGGKVTEFRVNMSVTFLLKD